MQSYAESILVVEDDPRIRAVVTDALRDTARVVHGVATVREAVAIASDGAVDLVALDLGLPDADGADACRALRDCTAAPIIVLSARRLEADKVALLDAGADDYVTKPFSVPEFVARVRAQLRRAHLYPAGGPAELRLGGLRIDIDRRTASRDGVAIRLTPVEWSLLRVLAARPGRTFTHRQLFHAAWGKTYGDPQLHLRVHITHLRRKIERNPSDPELIVTEPGVGYRCELPDAPAP
ncbi:MAG TPA: response regulator transcription factor [Gemmatimonadaceae bacterium]|nr:response regulator transcription factor [Gemmatimonadaceae bacterium]